MDNPALEKRLVDTVERTLRSRTSDLLMDQILKIISGPKQGLDELNSVLQKVRISVKLFVDEGLSDQLNHDLRAEANAP